MKRPSLFKVAPALAVILALTSTSAYGATNVRGGPTSTESKAAAQSTAAQSARQQGSVDTNSSAQGAARRARTGSFARNDSLTTKVKVTKKDRELSAHIADVDTFLHSACGSFLAPFIDDNVGSVKHLILDGPSYPQHKEMYEFVDHLAKTDEEALHALFYMHSTYSNAYYFMLDRPEFTATIHRLGRKLTAAGIVNDFNGNSFSINGTSASAILAAPGARALLHKLTDSKAQQEAREELAVERAKTLNVANAEKAFETMQVLKKYISSMYKKAGVEVLSPSVFMNEHLGAGEPSPSGDGGVILAFKKDDPFPVQIRTAQGVISYTGKTSYSSRADNFLAKYKEDLGLEPIDMSSASPVHRRYTLYAVTRLPDGTKITKATPAVTPPVTFVEVSRLALKVSEKARKGIDIKRY